MLGRARAIQDEINALGNLTGLGETTGINLYEDPTGVRVIVDIQECLDKIALNKDLASAQLLAQMTADDTFCAQLIAARVQDPESFAGYCSAPKFLGISLGEEKLRPYLALALMHIVAHPNYKEMRKQDEAELQYIQGLERAGYRLTPAQADLLAMRNKTLGPRYRVVKLYPSFNVGQAAIGEEEAERAPLSMHWDFSFRIEEKKFFPEVIQLASQPGFVQSVMKALEKFIITVDSHWIESEGVEQLATFRLRFEDPEVQKASAQLLAKIAHSADDGLVLLHRCLRQDFIVGLLAVIEAGSLDTFRIIAQEAKEALAQILFNQGLHSEGLRIGQATLRGNLQLPREPLAPLGSSDYPDFIKRQILQGLESIYAAGLYTKSTDELVEHVKILLLLWATGENEDVQIRAGVLASNLIKSATKPLKSDVHALAHSIMITLQQHEVPLSANVRVAGINLLRDIANNQEDGAEALALSILSEGGFRVFGDAPPLPGQSIREAMKAEDGVLTVVASLKTRPFDEALARILSNVSLTRVGHMAILTHLGLLVDSLINDQGENKHVLVNILKDVLLMPIFDGEINSILKKLNTKALLTLLEIQYSPHVDSWPPRVPPDLIVTPRATHADSSPGNEAKKEFYKRLSYPNERENFLAAGGVAQLLSLVGPAQSETRIALEAQKALGILAQDPHACAQISEAGGVEMLVRLLLSTDDRRSNISIAAELIEPSMDLDELRKIVANPLVIQRFITMLQRYQSQDYRDSESAVAALNVLGNIALHEEGLAAIETDPFSITKIVGCLASSWITTEVAAAGARALSNIVISHSAAKKVIEANGVAELVALTYGPYDHELDLQVMWALGNISAHKEGYKAIRDAGGLARILPRCLSPEEASDEIRHHALRALVHMLESKKVCGALAETDINALRALLLLPRFAEAQKGSKAEQIKISIEVALKRARVGRSPIPALAGAFIKTSLPRGEGPGPTQG